MKIDKLTIFGIVLIGVVCTASILGVYTAIISNDHTTPNPQSITVGDFTLHANYKQFDGNIQMIEGRVLHTGEHGEPNSYLWVVFVQGKGATAYVQLGDSPKAPTREQMCNDGLEQDNCMQYMIYNKLNSTGVKP